MRCNICASMRSASPVTTIIFAVDNFLRICGYIRGSMWLNILMSVLSAALEFLFLGVFHWGIWAAALATCTGMAVCAGIAFIPFFRRKALLRFCVPRFHIRMIRQIIACGSPNFLKQHCRPDHLNPDECHSGPSGRRNCRVRLWHSDVRRRLYPAADVRDMRLSPACSGI